MKRIFLLSAMMLLAAFYGFSQHNYKFNYQAVVRDGAGTLAANGSTVGLRISILEGSASGTALYQETHSVVVNNAQGLVNLVIGDGAASVGSILFSGNFQDLTQDKYLKIEVDPAGGTAYTDMGATKLQFVPYAAHAFTASVAEYAANGTQWENGAASTISYQAGNVNIGTNAPIGTAMLNVEEATSTDDVLSVTQTSTTGGGFKAAIYGKNNSTTGNGIGVYGSQDGNGWGVHGSASGASGTGVFATGARAIMAQSSATNGVAIELDGFMKVSGSKKTAFKTTPLVSAASNITLSYGGASNSDIVMVTPIGNSPTMPSWTLIWTSPNWVLWNGSDDGVPSNFPAGTSFNVLIIKQ